MEFLKEFVESLKECSSEFGPAPHSQLGIRPGAALAAWNSARRRTQSGGSNGSSDPAFSRAGGQDDGS